MLRLIILSVISFNLFADDTIRVSSVILNGTSSYSVWQESSSLKSKLIFPLQSTLLNIGYSRRFNDDIFFSFDYTIKIDSDDKKGEDYDWKSEKLSVYSSSKTQLKDYQSFLFETYLSDDPLVYIFSLSYRYMLFSWSDTNQIDYIDKKQIFEKEDSVSYSEDFIKLGFSPQYTHKYNDILFTITPSLYYSMNHTKDHHINRHFYAKSDYKGFSYGFNLEVGYKFFKSSLVKLYYKNFYFKDDSSKMIYTNDEGIRFRTIPSSFFHREYAIGLGLEYEL